MIKKLLVMLILSVSSVFIVSSATSVAFAEGGCCKCVPGPGACCECSGGGDEEDRVTHLEKNATSQKKTTMDQILSTN